MNPICPACGHLNPAGSRFCNSCGARLGTAPLPPQSETIEASVLPQGPAIGATIRLNQPPPAEPPSAPLPPAESATLLGDGRYRVERPIGHGGFGQALLVTDLRLGRLCIAKRLLVDPRWSAQQRVIAEKGFAREARLLTALNSPGHPNIPEIYEYLPAEQCLVMKYIAGQNLAEYVDQRGGRLDLSEALAIGRDLASALAYMHERPEPVLHRDIKPSNAIIDQTGRVWLIDFGLAKGGGPALPGVGGMSGIGGTLGFTAPEQWRSAAEPRSDVYALGATLLAVISGQRPQLSREDLQAIAEGKRSPFPPAKMLIPDLSDALAALLDRCLRFVPAERPSAHELQIQFAEILAPGARLSLETPIGGVRIHTAHEFARWAEQDWPAAADWLYGNLPEQVATILGQNRFAAELAAIRKRYPTEAFAGLDALLAHLDPHGFGASEPRLTSAEKVVDFGSLAADGRAEQEIEVLNPSRRLVRAQCSGPAWLTVTPPTLMLLPGARQRLRLRVDLRRAPSGGQLRAPLLIQESGGRRFQLEIRATTSRLRTLWAKATGEHAALSWSRLRDRQFAAHHGAIGALAISPDSTLVATGGNDGNLRCWQIEQGRLRAEQSAHRGNILSLGFSQNGRLIISCGSDGLCKIWESESLRLLNTIDPHVGYLEHLQLTAQGSLLNLVADGRTLLRYRLSDGSALPPLALPSECVAFLIGPDEQTALIGGRDGRLHLFDCQQANLLRTIATGGDLISSIAATRDGTTIANDGVGGEIFLWNWPALSARPRLIGHRGEVTVLTFHPNGDRLASAGIDGQAILWELAAEGGHQALPGPRDTLRCLAFSPDGNLLLGGDRSGRVSVWGPRL